MSASINQFDLNASIETLETLRYSPAGLAILDLWLLHESRAKEAGVERVVNLRIKAVAFGAVAQTLSKQDLKAAF
jgi:primosomal replication protein N